MTVQAKTQSKTTYSTCYMCTSNCPITVESHQEEILSINHPDCIRAEAMQEQRESELRLKKPQFRPTASSPWQPVSYSKALNFTATKLKEISEKYGPDSVVFAAGYTKEVRPYLQRLAYTFGSPHYITESSCCFSSGSIAAITTLGKEYAYYLGPSRGKYPETKCRLVWSNNPSASQIPYEKHHFLLETDEIPTIVVDPRQTSLAEKAAVHLQLRPGTDGALALGLANIIFKENLAETSFLDQYAHGLQEYKDYVQQFTPEKTSQITGIPAKKIIQAAKIYGKAKPAQISISPNATTHHTNGFQNHRAILLLSALCGNLDVPGGNNPWDKRFKETSISLYQEKQGQLGPQIGEKEYPVFTDYYQEGQGMHLAKYIESGKIKAIFSIGMNLMMWPNSKRLAKALKTLEFFATTDFVSTPTVEASTVFFPAATHLERQALITMGTGRIQYRPAAVTPKGEANGDTELIFELAAALGFKKQFWNGEIHQSYQERLNQSNLNFEDLPKNGEAKKVEIPNPTPQSYQQNGFGTPTGKVEFLSTILEKAGYDGLPRYQEPYWSPIRSPEIAKEYPLILTTGGRSKHYTHSQGRSYKKLQHQEPFPLIELNPADAQARQIEEGNWVEISSPVSKIYMKASLKTSIPPGMVHAFHGWPTANVNELIPDEGNDPISGYPCFKSSLCQVRKKK